MSTQRDIVDQRTSRHRNVTSCSSIDTHDVMLPAVRRGQEKRSRPQLMSTSSIQGRTMASTQPKFENTFRLEPRRRFDYAQVKKIQLDVLSTFLNDEGQSYDCEMCASLCVTVADVIRHKLRDTNMSRYKWVSHVIIGEKRKQVLWNVSRYLWNSEVDGHCTSSFQNQTLFAISTVYGVYTE